jgi:hypothetical protein
MPHAFDPNPKHPAVLYLVRLHADLGGKIAANKREAARLTKAMKNVEAVIKLYDPAYNLHRIAPRRRNRVNKWFKRGTMFREALAILKAAALPMTLRELSRLVPLLRRHAFRDVLDRLAFRTVQAAANAGFHGAQFFKAGLPGADPWLIGSSL